MSPSSRRIWALAFVFFAAAGVAAFHLGFLTLWQHEEWLVRSYQNRWTFRDVPTRRGTLFDRHGQVIAADQPGFELLGNYREFRRRHPVGAAVHGANLLSGAEDWVSDYFGYRDRPGDPPRAFDVLMQIPLDYLRDDHYPGREGIARDLRFYSIAVVSAVGGRLRSSVALDLIQAMEAERPVPVWQALGGDYGALRKAFMQRWGELEGLDRTLVEGEAGSRGLIQLLELWRQRRRSAIEQQASAGEPRPHWPQEDWFRPIRDRLPFELAAGIRMGHRDHPGLQLSPTVRRIYANLPGRQDTGSLAALIGSVRVLDRKDQLDDVEELVAGTLSEFRPWESLGGEPDGVVETANRSARAAMQRYYQSRGRTGTSGVELALEKELAGSPGMRWVERNKRAREQFLWSTLNVSPGRDMRLTLDLELQNVLESRVEDAFDRIGTDASSREVAMAIVDAESGDVLALGGRPVRVPTTLADDTEVELLRHWAPGLGSLGAPDVGSVAKPFVLLEYLSARRTGRAFQPVVGACPGKIPIRGMRLGCAQDHGPLGAEMALAQSCNVWFFRAAQGLEEVGVRRAFERVGFERVSDPGRDGNAYQAEIPGIASLASPRLNPGGQVLERQAIGYGVEVSALYVARAYAALATGSLPRLRLVDDGQPAAALLLDVAPEDLDLVQAGLRTCVVSGTARNVPWHDQELEVHGKTGTAEITKMGHNNAWFAGYLPRTHPDVPLLAFAAVAYFAPDEIHGADIAGEMVADLLREVDEDDELRHRYLRREGQR